jgi:soluble lytic murein transglycosylase-like protein
MHINPSSFPILPPSAATPERHPDRASGFQEALQSAVGRQAAVPESPAELAAAMRLRMLQQAIQLGDDGAETETFSTFSLPSGLVPKNYPAASQKIDLSEIRPTASLATFPARSSDRPQATASSSLPDIIERAAARYQVAPEVVRAVIRAESGFDPKAVSPAGAQGLMQLMPGTARDLGVTDPFDAEQNVMAGTRYLKQMLGRYGGDLDKALAAYNWGPGNLNRSGDGRLPTETRRYIARIKGYLEASG